MSVSANAGHVLPWLSHDPLIHTHCTMPIGLRAQNDMFNAGGTIAEPDVAHITDSAYGYTMSDEV